MDIGSFIDKWKSSGASERANKDSFLRDLCEVLDVEQPHVSTGDPERDRYVFERDAILLHDGEKHTVGKIDLYKHGCFILEAKQGSEAESKKIGTARRDTPAWNIAMQDAFGQALRYATTIEPAPPFLIVTDIGYCFDLYADFDGRRNYLRFPDALSSRISLSALAREPKHVETLRAIFTEPHSLDPSKRSVTVTREIAGYIANVARSLGDAGHEPVQVSKFLMRCLFTMFVEDIGLLLQPVFTTALRERWLEHPEAFPGEVQSLWEKMNSGGHLFGVGNIWQFNGGLFDDPTALPLTKQQLGVLALAAQSDWSHVEPAIFGTLLERALDPIERHRLGAHYTPRAYVERLVRPTIEEPLRAEWDNVRAQVQKLVSDEDPDKNIKAVAEARKIVSAFHDRLTQIRVLDPACGSGNFLYVALDLFKRIENEVIALLENLGSDRTIITFGRMVTPQQFLGIEIKEWAKEITELVLWIGWLQWQIRTRGYKNHPEEPILRDYHNIERRDAVLAYDEKVPLLDDDGNEVTRWDGETTKPHPVTGEDVPDETARVPVYRYVNPKKAEWPEAEFVVGNPPYIGARRIRASLGDGYVDALRAAYPEVPETVDLVMYWWHKAAQRIANGVTRRFGLITTNSITQNYSRPVLENHLSEGVRLAFAIPDHPWVDAADGADVRVAMTVGASTSTDAGLLGEVVREDGESVEVEFVAGLINASLTLGTSMKAIQRLQANQNLCFQGVVPAGEGFKLTPEESQEIGHEGESVLRPYIIGRDVVQRPQPKFIIDFFGLDESAARLRHPALYQHILDRVAPERRHNPRAAYRQKWWLFAEPRPAMRKALGSGSV